MGNKYFQYAGRSVDLVDVLEYLDERIEMLTASIIHAHADADKENGVIIWQKIGKVQGAEWTLNCIKQHFGAFVMDALTPGGDVDNDEQRR